MNTLEGRAWRALAGSKGIGAKALWQLADYLFSRQQAASWLLRHPDKARDALASRAGIVFPEPDLLKYQEEAAGAGRETTVLHPLHPQFPARIKELRDKLPLPAILYAAGNLSLLNRAGVAIVGKRNADDTGLAMAEKLAARLAAQGIAVISGYASGIDSAAHLGALRSGGATIAVLAEGLGCFQVKPEFKGLLTDENALVVSQFAPGDRWVAYQAMARNKLVAALAKALVVIVAGAERDAAGRHSGTFDAGISALKLALPVFVVDPSFFSAPPDGNRELIKRGARAWEPRAGIEPIISALHSPARPAGQMNLF